MIEFAKKGRGILKNRLPSGRQEKEKNYMNTLKDFYPTNKTVIAKMLDGVKFGKLKTILEPSAGKGDIVDAVKKQ